MIDLIGKIPSDEALDALIEGGIEDTGKKTGILYKGCSVNVSGDADPISIYASESNEHTNIMGMYYKRRHGRVIGIGSYTVFRNNTSPYNIFKNANRKLVKNIFLYLCERFREEIREKIIDTSEKKDIIYLYDFAEKNNVSVRFLSDIAVAGAFWIIALISYLWSIYKASAD